MTGSLLDSVLDRSVIGGYTNVGYWIRGPGWSASELPSLDGRVVMVTGATSGLGLAAAKGFAHLGATVWLVVRSEERGQRARAAIAGQSGNHDVHVGLCDLSDLQSVRQFAERCTAPAERLDVLVNDAGVLPSTRALSPDRIEMTFATNVLGPFVLTNLLLPRLERSAPARIINVSSGGMYTQRIRLDDLQSARGEFDGATAYARAKRAQVILTEMWARRLEGRGVVVHSMHRGWAETPGVANSLPRFYKLTRPLLRTPQQGADTIVWLGAADEPGRSTCLFWHDRRPRPTHLLPWTRRSSSSASSSGRDAPSSAAGRSTPPPQTRRNTMARYRATIDTPRERDDVFAYLSDFSTAQEWDPGVVEAERLNDAAVEEGTEFRLVAEFLGRKTALTYRIAEYDPPHAVTFRGANASVISNDRITLEAVGESTRITYDAELLLKGPLRLADPLLGLAFNRVGDRALAGLKHKLAPVHPEALSALSGRSLDGRSYELPGDLAKPYNLLVVAFRREQQAVVDRWLPWLIELEQRRGDVAVYELPVLSSVYGPARWFIDGGMTRGIPDPAARARTVTVYTDVQKVVENLGLAGTDTIAVLVAERSGRILACEHGGFEPEKAERLATALTPEPPAEAAAA